MAYNIITNGIGTPTRAYIAQGNNVFLELNASFTGGSATGTQAVAVSLSPLVANASSYSVRVEGPGGNLQGTLRNAGSGGGGPDPEPGECPSGYFTDARYEDFSFRVNITTPDGTVQAPAPSRATTCRRSRRRPT
ncbi:MAG TPA: hypothetical protein VHN15_09165, partial [Thermoanaerobaculia bacterium]|nr:hypothetical protein [Thermoanaerobaculia bacterium]